jgi:hypothetical protein
LATSLRRPVFQSALIVRPGSPPPQKRTIASSVQRHSILQEGRTLVLAAKAGPASQARLVALRVCLANTSMLL